MVNRRPGRHSPLARIPVSASTAASPLEAAAIVAALERFMRDTAASGPDSSLAPTGVDPWARMAVLEGVGREDEWPSAWICSFISEPWINT
jgi:hypothetical protein